MKMLLVTLVNFIFLITAYCQSPGQKSYRKQEFFIAASGGIASLGPSPDIESQMKLSGFGDTSPASMFGPALNHPFSRRGGVFIFEAGYYFKKQMGFLVDYGLINNVEVLGYEKSGYSGNYLFIDNKVKMVSIAFSYRSKDQRINICAGPAILFHTASDQSSGNNSLDTHNTEMGLQIGSAPILINKKIWFLALDGRYCWSAKSQLGPFVTDGADFPVTTVGISSFYLGLSLGFRLYTL